MIDLFMPFRAFLKFENVCTDNNVFRMHYKITVIMLLVFTLLVTSKQFFGEPIHCMSDNDKDDKDAINSYCWIYGTYTLKSKLEGVEGKHMAYPGIGPHRPGSDSADDQIKHTYYQWVCFVLLGQACMFYAPRYLWQMWEGGRLKALAGNLNSPLVSEEWTERRRKKLVSYLSYTNIYTHNMYALRYAFCEILNLVNVLNPCPPDVVRELLAHGAHIDTVNYEGQTPEEILRASKQSLVTIVNPLRYTTLKCLAARTVKNYKLPYRHVVPECLHSTIITH